MGWPVTKESTIYCIRCKENGKVYIGRTQRIESRIKEHFQELRRNQKRHYSEGRYGASGFQEDYNKFGEDSFEVYILEENVSPENCKARERYWIKHYNSANPFLGYNFLDEHIENEVSKEMHRSIPITKSEKDKADLVKALRELKNAQLRVEAIVTDLLKEV